MDIQLIQLYVLVCELYDMRRRTCFQRLSNNANPDGITDQELVTIYCFAHLHGHFEKKAMRQFIQDYWLAISSIVLPQAQQIDIATQFGKLIDDLISLWRPVRRAHDYVQLCILSQLLLCFVSA